ncbi:MAG: hypothetical protein QM493_04860 [Sulfurovum sp.]
MGMRLITVWIMTLSLVIASTMPSKRDIVDIKEEIKSINEINSTKVAIITKEDINIIFNDNFVNILSKIQSEYKSAILLTNGNITYFGSVITIFGFLITIMAILVSMYNLYIVNSLKKKVLSDLEGEILTIRGDITKEIKIETNREIKQRTKRIVSSEIKLARKRINKIHNHQHKLFYYINNMFSTQLSKVSSLDTEEFQKIYATYNINYKLIADITSLDRGIMIETIKQLDIPKREQLRKSKVMQDYLKDLKEYDNNIELFEAINEVLL